MAKTNGCLVAGMCLRNILAGAHCDYTCDEEFMEETKAHYFDSLMRIFVNRVPAHVLKRWRKLFKGVYFGREGSES